jgi:hypothetical protein
MDVGISVGSPVGATVGAVLGKKAAPEIMALSNAMTEETENPLLIVLGQPWSVK